jgi:hypothetical protein
LTGIESELRERIFGRWTGHVRRAGHDEVQARAIVWAIVNAAFGLADQVEREALSVEQAVALLGLLVSPFTAPSPTGGRRQQTAGRDSGVDHYGKGTPYAH